MAVTFITRTKLTIAAGSYQDVDVSAYVSADATGVMLEVVNTSTTVDYSIMIRQNGSTDDRYSDIYRNCRSACLVGIDADDIFEVKIENVAVEIYLIGYTEEEATYKVNGVDVTTGGIGSYVVHNIAAETGVDTALGGIFETYSTTFGNFGVRAYNNTSVLGYARFYYHYTLGFVCGVDSAGERYEVYRGSDLVKHYLIGYFTDDVWFPWAEPDIYCIRTFVGYPEQTTDWTRHQTYLGAYDINYYNDEAIGVFIMIPYNYTSSRSFDIRPKGGSGIGYYDMYRRSFTICETGVDNEVEVRQEAYFIGGAGTDYAIWDVVGLIGVTEPKNFPPAGASPTKVYIYDASGPSYTDETTDAVDVGTNDFYFWPSPIGAGDKLLICNADNKFKDLGVIHSTAGAGTYALDIQYWDGASWVNFSSVTEIHDGGDLKAAGTTRYHLSVEDDWVSDTINGQVGYWAAISYAGGTVTTRPIGTRIVTSDLYMNFTTYITESLSLSDLSSLNISWSPSFADYISLSDLPSKYFEKYNQETLSLSDLSSLNTAWLSSFADYISLSDLPSKYFEKYNQDYLSLSDLPSKSFAKPNQDTLSLSALSSLNTSWTPSYLDNIILNDNADIVKILGDYPYPNDVIPLLDTIGKRVTKYIVDYVNVIDSLHGLNTKPLAVFDYFYLTDYTVKGIHKYVSDSFNLSEFMAIFTQGHLRFFESSLSLSDSVAKLFARPVRSWFELWQHLRLLRVHPAPGGFDEYDLWINEQERLSETIEKVIYAPKGDTVGLIITVVSGNTLTFQDNIALTDEIVKAIGKNITEVINITESPSTLFSEIVYFDNAEIYPEYIVTGVHFYGGAEMHVFPSQTCIVEWDIRDFETETLYDPDSHTVEIYDCRNSRRVAYDSSKLVKESTGHYKYAFTVPDTVVAGDWYAKVKATKGTSSTVLHVHFEVKKR